MYTIEEILKYGHFDELDRKACDYLLDSLEK
jgi:hypothetical protein